VLLFLFQKSYIHSQPIQRTAQTMQTLLHSQELKACVHASHAVLENAASSSRQALCAAGGAVVHTVCLPVTLPMQLATATTHQVVTVAGSVWDVTMGSVMPSSEEDDTASKNLVDHLLCPVPLLLDTAGKMSNQLLGWVVPERRESLAEDHSVLRKLRLDIHLNDGDSPTQTTSKKIPTPRTPYSNATASDFTKALLCVIDLNVMVSPDPADSPTKVPVKALYIDVASDFANATLTTDSLAQLMQYGVQVCWSNTLAHLGVDSTPSSSCNLKINWKPEGTTNKVLSQITKENLFSKLSDHVLVWSAKPKDAPSPFFLARGVVQKSPRSFLDLMWDSSRTEEYNPYSLGRSDKETVLQDFDGDWGAKTIQSETKIPFTNKSVTLQALMHAKAFPDGSYVIVSRSLSSGPAGCHTISPRGIESAGNEILLGVNWMRPVPGKPHLTDLLSVSQVSSKILPQFLAFKIGMMGLQDFFDNVRK